MEPVKLVTVNVFRRFGVNPQEPHKGPRVAILKDGQVSDGTFFEDRTGFDELIRELRNQLGERNPRQSLREGPLTLNLQVANEVGTVDVTGSIGPHFSRTLLNLDPRLSQLTIDRRLGDIDNGRPCVTHGVGQTDTIPRFSSYHFLGVYAEQGEIGKLALPTTGERAAVQNFELVKKLRQGGRVSSFATDLELGLVLVMRFSEEGHGLFQATYFDQEKKEIAFEEISVEDGKLISQNRASQSGVWNREVENNIRSYRFAAGPRGYRGGLFVSEEVKIDSCGESGIELRQTLPPDPTKKFSPTIVAIFSGIHNLIG